MHINETEISPEKKNTFIVIFFFLKIQSLDMSQFFYLGMIDIQKGWVYLLYFFLILKVSIHS